MTEKLKTESKKLKKESKDERILITWAVGFMWLIIAALVSGMQEISLSILGGFVLVTMGMAVLLKAARKFREKREARKYDTGSLALETT